MILSFYTLFEKAKYVNVKERDKEMYFILRYPQLYLDLYQNERLLPCPMPHPSTQFCGNPFISFWVTLLTNNNGPENASFGVILRPR